MKLISTTTNGQVFKCDSCKAIHIEYKNINLNFSEKQFKRFADFLNTLDGESMEESQSHSPYQRKIAIATSHKAVNVLLNKEELEELKLLLSRFDKETQFLKVEKEFVYAPKVIDLNFSYFLN